MSRATPCRHAAGNGCVQHGMHGDTKHDLFRKHAWRSLRPPAAAQDGTRVCCMNASTMHTASAAQCSTSALECTASRWHDPAATPASAQDMPQAAVTGCGHPSSPCSKEMHGTEEQQKRQHPTLWVASTLAPLSSSRRDTSRWPISHASIRAVSPSCRCSKAPHMQP
jgi:hypothetical protein